MLEADMLTQPVWAVVGANNDPAKYGNIIFKTLKSRGYRLYPVNPTCNTVEGEPCYKDLTSLPEKPGVINLVVSPQRGKAFIEEAATLGIDNIWLQPGTYDAELMALIKAKELNAVQSCVL